MRFLRALLAVTLLGTPAQQTLPARDLAYEVGATSDERRLLDDFYAADSRPVWMTTAGELTDSGHQALALLAGADSHGLHPADYQVAVGQTDPIRFEMALSLSMLRYLGHISIGRVTSASLRHQLSSGISPAALPAILREHVATGRTSSVASAVMPTVGHYEGVRRALATYRALAQRPEPPVLPTNAPSIRVGDPLPWATALRLRLDTFGDLGPTRDGDSVALEDAYTPSLEAGVKSFQRRHGLLDDGVLGRGTIAALNVPVTTRVRQLEMALERLRWLRRDLDGPFVLVNIPMYRLWAWDQVGADAPVMTMKVVVGTPGRNATPVFTSTMERVIFRPYWNVPRSIVNGEILPKVRVDANYLAAHAYELVRGETDRGAVVSVTPESLEALRQGALRLRQRPGPANALGLVKFEFPNPYNVFLHDTPTQSAFLRDVRALSHGCVRVENPVGLASWVLNTSMEAVQQSTRGSNVQMVPVPRPVHVLVTYATAAVDADGTVRFAQDIYGHDTRLDKALRPSSSGVARDQ